VRPGASSGPSTSPLDANVSAVPPAPSTVNSARRWTARALLLIGGCTDVGTRIITAISLEPHEVVEHSSSSESSKIPRTRRYVTTDPSWLSGPPYQVAEAVFDEYDIEGCSLTQEGRQDGERVAV
jgi:hypothetical protein